MVSLYSTIKMMHGPINIRFTFHTVYIPQTRPINSLFHRYTERVMVATDRNKQLQRTILLL